MSKFIMFARAFPAYHPKKGASTNFVEKLWSSIGMKNWSAELEELNPQLGPFDINDSGPVLNAFGNEIIDYQGPGKHHTIRAGHRWKAGDKFSPRVWSGKPYNSKMITIAPDITIAKVWKFEIADNSLFLDGKDLSHAQWIELAKNDGLTVSEMLEWFKYPTDFSGQIICWNPNLEY